MTIKDAILAALREERDEKIVGRTLLQKKLYFLSVLIGEDFGFVPHYYGPYSPAVADDMGALVGAGFVDENVKVSAASSQVPDERRLYIYRLSEFTDDVIKDRKDEIARYGTAVQKINQHSVSGDASLLAVAAKVHFILSKAGKASAPEIEQRARDLGWKINDPQIRNVVGFLQHLGLVRTTQSAGR